MRYGGVTEQKRRKRREKELIKGVAQELRQ